jgi:putative addiction module component (TIGR02574 family)
LALAKRRGQTKFAAMSKLEILAELPKLEVADRREILDRIWEMEEDDLIRGSGATAEEKALLDRELEEYRRNPEAGSTWNGVEARIRKSSRP